MAKIPFPLDRFGWKGSSQNNETGILLALFAVIAPRHRFFVEFGIGPNHEDHSYQHGLEGNCVDLAALGWNGLYLDGGDHPPQFGVRKAFLSAENINRVLAQHDVPSNFSLISIDVDGQDYWIWKALEYRPEVVVIEYNSNLSADVSAVVPRDDTFRWDLTQYYGASLRALDNLGREKGYVLVYANGVNAFFVMKDLVANPADFVFENIYRHLPIHAPDPAKRAFLRV